MTTHRSARVLIIEDDPFIALDMQDIVEDAGYHVIGPCASPVDAIALLERDGPPDCALMDFHVRGGTTEPVARRLDTMDVPYVFVTANRCEVLAALPSRDPMVRSKPVPPSRILEDVSLMLA